MPDARGFEKPDHRARPATQPIDLTVPGTGGVAMDYGAAELDNRSAAHHAEDWPGVKAEPLTADSPLSPRGRKLAIRGGGEKS
jgi:hypothetical protein